MARQHYGRELWETMCKFVEKDDGGPTTPLGIWTADKLFFLGHYLAIVAKAKKLKESFSAIEYIDLFCGNGVCTALAGNRTRRYPGSPLLAAGCGDAIDKLILVDERQENIDAIEARLAQLPVVPAHKAMCGDANAMINSVASQLTPRAFGVAFLDPFSLGIHYSSLKILTAGRAIDLIILFPDAMDIVRNIDEYYYPKRSLNLDLSLGEEFDWRPRWDAIQNRDGRRVREFASSIFVERLRSLGYDHTDVREIRSINGPIYKLVFASKHPLGLKFWNIACSESLAGERDLFTN